ncbi:hypothetical protein OKW33_000089 [Paraburkholderia atlantica]|uniref:Uncharacterized protein n=1 Tax=Paraburkholderia atlantica TaxID=2654982 RepID=A0A7W8QCV0_PARAM|nr:hypothetical protein [Paraburkholderia atlantica]MBB5427894.1 hypothetical protein [Paraburkholderia atlantica]
MNAPLLFQPCADAVYGFPHARLDSFDAQTPVALRDGPPDSPAAGLYAPTFCAPRIAALLGDRRAAFARSPNASPHATSIRCVMTNRPCTRGYSRQHERRAIN